MKKLMFSVLLLLFVVVAKAQNVGVTAGANFARMSMFLNDGTEIEGLSSVTTYRAGLTFENTLIKNKFFLEFSLLAAGRGVKFEDADAQVNLHYVEIPMILKYKFDFDKRRHYGIFIGAGAYAGGGYAGKDNNDEKIKFGKEEDDDFKPFDFGASAGLGFYYGPVQLAWNYEHGFANAATDDGEVYHRIHSFTLSYYFLQD